MCRRLIVPVAVEGDVPLQVAGDLDVVSRVSFHEDPARLRKSREGVGANIQVGFVEAEELELRTDPGRADIFRRHGCRGLYVIDVLPSKSADQGNACIVRVLQVAPNASG